MKPKNKLSPLKITPPTSVSQTPKAPKAHKTPKTPKTPQTPKESNQGQTPRQSITPSERRKSSFSINFFKSKDEKEEDLRQSQIREKRQITIIQEHLNEDSLQLIENEINEQFEEIEETIVKNKHERQIDDFVQYDINKRNILHRACVDQQKNIIIDICNEFQMVAEQMIDGDKESVKEQLRLYVNKPDKFTCNPLLLCCFKEGMLHEKSQRFNCIQYLVSLDCEVNTLNQRTLWSPLHWCSYYGDYESVAFLLKQGITTHRPDYKGLYPIDLAGRKKHKSVVELLLQHGVKLLLNYEGFPGECFQIFEDKVQSSVDKIIEQDDKWLKNPIFRCKLLYWAVTVQVDIKYIKMLIQLSRIYYLVPILHEQSMTSLHAASQIGNFNAIKLLLENQFQLDDAVSQKLASTNKKQSIKSNQVFIVSKQEKSNYTDQFYEQVIKFAEWEIKYLQSVPKKQTPIIPINETQIKIQQVNLHQDLAHYSCLKKRHLYIDQQDSFGNTALHLASLKGHSKIVDYLLTSGSNMEAENNELFKARQLTQHKQVLDVYHDKMKLISKKEVLEKVNQNLWISLKELYQSNPKSDELKLINTMSERIYDPSYLQQINALFGLSNETFLPDFVLKAQITNVTKSSQTPSFFDLLSTNNSELQKLNFQISLLSNANFEIFLMKSYYEEGFYYIMIRNNQHDLEQQAQLMQLQMKLMDGFDLEPYQKKYQMLFEPFRSRQRQQIIEAHLQRLINIEELIKGKVLDCCYRMHSFGGIQKIREQWIQKPKWYWPQPLNQMGDYLSEGSSANFTSITILRLYFGEKISFFFAWKSYLTCALLSLAIPGLAIQLYIIYTKDYDLAILPYWVFYVCVWSTLQVEFWKRKTSEINTRWGSLDLLQNVQQNINIRDGFSGDEEIYDVTGKLTKHEKKAETLFILLISIPILSGCIALCIIIFLVINYLVVHYAQGNTPLKIGLGVLQGLGITILNKIYTLIAKKFVQIENHKYEEAYETSMIFKNAAFKFINSYLAIIYTSYFKDSSTLESIFQLMLPVLIVKQLNYVALDVFLPQMIYKRKERLYFEKQKQIIHGQNQVNDKNPNNYIFYDVCQKFWQTLFSKPLQCSQRAILQIEGDKDDTKPKSGFEHKQQLKLISHMDADFVELNSLKLNFDGTLNYFMEGIIDIGYITLFAAAFPIGPFLSLLANIVEIKMKMFSFLYVYKRPESQRCSGIGDWLNILEVMSVVSVFSNFLLLYLKSKKQTEKQLFNYDEGVQNQVSEQYGAWLFIASIFFLLGIKMFFQWIIPDRPNWVIQEIERMNNKSAQQSGSAESVSKAQGQLLILNGKLEKANRIYTKKKNQFISQMNVKNDSLKKLQSDLDHEIKLKQIEQEMLEKKNILLEKIGAMTCTSELEYSNIQTAIFKQKYIELEHIMIILRLSQITNTKTQFMFICQDCGEREAIFECQECDEAFCQRCYKFVHKAERNYVHSVILTKKLSSYDPVILEGMNLTRRTNLNKQVIKFQRDDVKDADNVRRWKKFQHFAFPINPNGQFYKYLAQIFDFFYKEYITDNGLNDNNFTFRMDKIFRYNKSTDLDLGYTIIESQNIAKILNINELNVEDKLFLNRIAFLTFKKFKNKAKFENFYKICKIFESGTLEQKILIFLDMCDLNDDGNITKSEIHRIFLASFVQDLEGESKVWDTVNSVFDKGHQENYSKKDAAVVFMHGLKNSHINEFIAALLQIKQENYNDKQ